MNSRATVAELYTPIYDQFMMGTFKEHSQKWQEAFVGKDDNTKEYKVDDLSGLGTWEDTEELEAGPVEDPVLGYPKTYTPTKSTKTFSCSFESHDDDEYALLKKSGNAEEMGTGARDKVERVTAGVLINGFTSTVNSPDGQFLWDNDHPKNREETGTVFDNLLAGAFSHDNLEAAETQIANNLFSMKGIPIDVDGEVTLMHPTALRGAIERVLNERALERPTTQNRDINRFVGKATKYKYKPVEWIYLNSAMGGSDTAWYLIFKWLGKLKVIWRQRPAYTSWVDENIDAYYFKGRMRMAAGCDNWRCGFASTGL